MAHINIVEEYVPVNAPPYIETTFPVPPNQAIRRWVADRLRPTGGDVDLTIVITQADVTAEQIPVKGGLEGLFRDDQNRKWTAHLAANLILKSIATGQTVTTTGFHIEHLLTTAESATAKDQRKAQAQLMQKAMDDFNHMATLTFRQDMPQILAAPE